MIIQGYQCLVNLLGAYLELRDCCFRPRAGILRSLPGANTPAVENRSSRPVCAESYKTEHKSNVLSWIPTCPECLKALPLRGRACSKRKEQNNGNSRKVQAALQERCSIPFLLGSISLFNSLVFHGLAVEPAGIPKLELPCNLLLQFSNRISREPPGIPVLPIIRIRAGRIPLPFGSLNSSLGSPTPFSWEPLKY